MHRKDGNTENGYFLHKFHWNEINLHLTFFPLAVVLFPTGVGERSSGQSHVNSGQKTHKKCEQTPSHSALLAVIHVECVPSATNGTILFWVLLLYNCCIKWNKSLPAVVITPVLSYVYVQYQKSSGVIVLGFFWLGTSVFIVANCDLWSH